MSTFFVTVPSGKDKAGGVKCLILNIILGRDKILRSVFSIFAYIRAIWNSCYLFQFADRILTCNSIAISIHIYAVKISQSLQVSCVVKIDFQR